MTDQQERIGKHLEALRQDLGEEIAPLPAYPVQGEDIEAVGTMLLAFRAKLMFTEGGLPVSVATEAAAKYIRMCLDATEGFTDGLNWMHENVDEKAIKKFFAETPRPEQP